MQKHALNFSVNSIASNLKIIALILLLSACGESEQQIRLWDKVQTGMSYDEVLKAYENNVVKKFKEAIVVKTSFEFGMDMSPLIHFKNGTANSVVLRVPDNNNLHPARLRANVVSAIKVMRALYGKTFKEDVKRPAYGPRKEKLIWQQKGLRTEAFIMNTSPIIFSITVSKAPVEQSN